MNERDQVLSAYESWLLRQPLARNTQDAYRYHVRKFWEYLATRPSTGDDPLRHPFARDYAVRDYKRYLKTERKAKPASVNLTLAAIDHFYQFLGLDRVRVQREDLPQKSPRALKLEEQKAFLRAVERSTSLRDQALARLLFYTGLRLSECAALNVDDILISARKGMVIVRSGKGETYREVPLNAEVRKALKDWLKERSKRFPGRPDPALFLSLKARRLSTRAIDLVLRRFGADAKLEVSAHILRHTCLTNLYASSEKLRNRYNLLLLRIRPHIPSSDSDSASSTWKHIVRLGNDLVLVAEVAGHKRLETTRRYSLPSVDDRERAMEGLQVDY